jgi:hypothetical protein
MERNTKSEPIVVYLPHGETIEVNEDEWRELAAANWNSLEDDGYVQWSEVLRGNADGRTLVYVVEAKPDGIVTVAGEILPAQSPDVEAAVQRLANRFGIPTNVPHSCVAAYRRGRHGGSQST